MLKGLSRKIFNKKSELPPGPVFTTTPTKTERLKAFRTIITLLSKLDSPNGQPPDEKGAIATEDEDLKELRVLDALSTILIRKSEVTAVVAPRFDGDQFQVFTSPIFTGNAKPSTNQSDSNTAPDNYSLQSGSNTRGGVQDFIARVYNFAVAPNPRLVPVHKKIDSLMNTTPLPLIQDCVVDVDENLVTAAQSDGLLISFLDTYWGEESFDTHAWMVQTLLGRVEDNNNDSVDEFLHYIIAISFEKMNIRTTKSLSKRYLECLTNLDTSYTSTFFRSPEPMGWKTKRRDSAFAEAIPFLAQHFKLPNLLEEANCYNVELAKIKAAGTGQQPATKFYNPKTCVEFHNLLCKLLTGFKKALGDLKALSTSKSKKVGAPTVLEALKGVRSKGHYLRLMVRTSAMEVHLQKIGTLLAVDDGKMWEPADSEDPDDFALDSLKPYSLRKGKPLLPWESYRDWLLLLVHYFDAADILSMHVKRIKRQLGIKKPLAISISILSLPRPETTMIPWTTLLETEYFFPAEYQEPSGKEFVNTLVSEMPDLNDENVKALMRLGDEALLLKGDLILHHPDLNDRIGALAEKLKDCVSVNLDWADLDEVHSHIIRLKGEDVSAKQGPMQTIVDMIRVLARHADFYCALKQTPLQTGDKVHGTYHCEAYIASLLTLNKQASEQILEDTNEISEILEKLKGCQPAIGVSKRCCPVCASLLHFLNTRYKTKFVISDEHTCITACALPPWLPEEIVSMMVEKFSKRLRVELGKLRKSILARRARTRSSDTGRMSLDSNGTESLGHDGPNQADANKAFEFDEDVTVQGAND